MKIISLLTLFFTANILLSQQLPQFTEYDANLSMYNPAYTGMKGKMYGNFSGRIQWAGMEGNPNTYAGLYEHQIGKNSVGGSFMYDQLGFEKNHRTASVYIPMNTDSQGRAPAGQI